MRRAVSVLTVKNASDALVLLRTDPADATTEDSLPPWATEVIRGATPFFVLAPFLWAKTSVGTGTLVVTVMSP
jgi:hypothetical protein